MAPGTSRSFDDFGGASEAMVLVKECSRLKACESRSFVRSSREEA